jgi:hypothetical protein
MRRYRFDASAGRSLIAFGSTGAFVTPILRPTVPCHAVAIYLEPGGLVAAHPASADQLFLVVAGSGVFSGGESVPYEAIPGCAAFWAQGEMHETLAGPEGLIAVVLEGDGLGVAITLPLWDEPIAS